MELDLMKLKTMARWINFRVAVPNNNKGIVNRRNLMKGRNKKATNPNAGTNRGNRKEAMGLILYSVLNLIECLNLSITLIINNNSMISIKYILYSLIIKTSLLMMPILWSLFKLVVRNRGRRRN